MKLRNKRTGEIIEVLAKISFIKRNDNFIDSEVNTFNSLAELNEEWEDYQEPKEYWYIEPNGVIARIDEWDCCTDSDIEIMKTLGNYFETKEEAEQAVEKLKAWKRLKDKGFKFEGYNPDFEGMGIIYPNDCSGNWCWEEDKKDLDLLFGGEE